MLFLPFLKPTIEPTARMSVHHFTQRPRFTLLRRRFKYLPSSGPLLRKSLQAHHAWHFNDRHSATLIPSSDCWDQGSEHELRACKLKWQKTFQFFPFIVMVVLIVRVVSIFYSKNWYQNYPIRLSLSMIKARFLFLGVSPVAQWYRIHLSRQQTWVRSLDWEDPLEKEMAIQSSTPAWKTPGQRSLADYSPWGH